MKIQGLQKLTLLDYPEHTACTVFTPGCNFRCPFCHNASLVIRSNDDEICEDEFFAFLQKRKNLLDGVCITGGEPTLQPDLIPFMKKVRKTGYLIKLDTNGYRPEILKKVLDEGLCDYVAMDIKSSPLRYDQLSGVSPLDFSKIKNSIELLRNSGIDHEFRTTVVDQLHSETDFEQIGRLLEGEEKYFLQSFVDSGDCIVPGFSGASPVKMKHYLAIVQKYVPHARLRGM